MEIKKHDTKPTKPIIEQTGRERVKWEYLTVTGYSSCSVARWKSQSVAKSIEGKLLAVIGKGIKVTIKEKGATIQVQGCTHEEFLDVLGAEGWEFAGVGIKGSVGSTDSILYFKRPLVS